MIMSALILPVLAAVTAGAVDYSALLAQKNRLQQAADAAALGGANELYLAGAEVRQVQEVANSIARRALAGRGDAKIETSLPPSKDEVTVQIKQDSSGVLTAAFGVFDTTLAVRATARVVGGGRLCVVGLESNGAGVIRLDKNAQIVAPTCSVYSNSSSPQGLQSKQNAKMQAEFICSAGGKVGGKSNFSPDPVLDCPLIEDPLGARKPVIPGSCVASNLVLGETKAAKTKKKDATADWRPTTYETVTLTPGRYCGGLTINGPYDVKLEPGIYAMDGGPLRVGGGAKIRGRDVGFFFTGKGATLHLQPKSSIDLEAPRTGSMAGMLFQESDRGSGNPKHLIESEDARNLLGTIYFPRGTLEVISNGTIADRSAYTVIVVRKLTLDAGPNLVLNTDYNATEVPVPRGVGPVGGGIVLSE